MQTFCRTLLLVLLLALPAVVQAQFTYTNSYGIWTYTTTNGRITITGYTGRGGDVTIPDRIPDTTNGLPVTNIEDWAFTHSYGVTSVAIPDSVISIGDGGFWDCINLTSVTISNGVTSIGRYAFEGCTSLPSVTIPASVTNIGDAVFVECSSLTAITVDALNSVYSSVGGVLFNNSQTTLIEYPRGKVGSYTVPDSVTSIGEYAFSFCASLTSLTIPNGLRNIGDWAFLQCASLTNVTIGTSVTSIGDEAFEFCTSLTGVYCRGNAPSVGSGVYDGDNNATVYYLPGTTGWGSTLGGLGTALWFLPNPLILNNGPSFGVQTHGFGFIISWATNISVVVEACTNLAHSIWSPVATNALTGGWSYFSDPQGTNYPTRLYRIRSP